MAESHHQGAGSSWPAGPSWPVTVLTGAVQLYQLSISPLLGRHCRFAPSCSQYAATALRSHGVWRGLRLAARRIARCHPWHPGGWDPVP